MLCELLDVAGNDLVPDSRVGVQSLELLTTRVGELQSTSKLLHLLLVNGGSSLHSASPEFEKSLGVVAQRLVALCATALLDCCNCLGANLGEKLLIAGGDVELLVQVGDDLGEDGVDNVLVVLVDGGAAVLLTDVFVELVKQLQGLEANQLGDLLTGLGNGG